ncbi:MAG: phytoene/squalene synthase family protein [Armatimonadota bacterium]|nr:MAG: phytoene/squalene synthase family protein [Armatimonadota bacterium]
MTESSFTQVFKRGSTTFFNTSLFFPAELREKVTRLYAFVREADDYVDSTPQDVRGFMAFRQSYAAARTGAEQVPAVVRSFVALEREYGFDPQWAQTFLDTMQLDLTKDRYETLEETLSYVYGSAEVVGLMMASLMELPHAALEHAQLLGRAFQYINFIRDVREDTELGRQYLPAAEMHEHGLRELSAAEAVAHPSEFADYIGVQLVRYRAWRGQAERGYTHIPPQYLIAISAAADIHDYTAAVIARDPLVVFRRKVKPRKATVFLAALRNALRLRGGR